MENKLKFMKSALDSAKKAFDEGEVPIGAVVVCGGKIISRGYNKRTKRQIATAHAEIEAIEKACKKLKSWRIPECEIYVTLEPCPMCMGAMLNARIKKVYFGAYVAKGRSMTEQLAASNLVNHTVEVEGGVMEKECAEILSSFFIEMRAREKVREKAGKEILQENNSGQYEN